MEKFFTKTKDFSVFVLILLFFAIFLFFLDVILHNRVTKEEDLFIKGAFVVVFVSYFLKEIYIRTKVQTLKTEKILNSQRNIVIVTNGENIVEANKAFLDFFEFDTLKDFKKVYKCVCDHFIEEDSFLWEKMGEISWAEYIFLYPNRQNLAKIQKGDNLHIFKVLGQAIDNEEIEVENRKLVVTFEDITKELEVNRLLKEQTRKLESMNEAKMQFLSNIGQELKTPLNSIVGFVKLFFDTKLNQTQYELLKKLDNSSNILLNTVNDILDITSIEANRLIFLNNTFSFNELKYDLEAIVYRLSIENNNHFQIILDKDLPMRVVSDKARILQVLTILLSNAFKYTKNGNVSFIIKLLENTVDNKVKIEFSISDTGIGISKESMNKLFEEFFRADEIRAKNYLGNGIGLAIGQNIIKAFGSKIDVESTPNVGSTFSFVLELDTKEQDDSYKYEYPIFEDVSILVVENNEANQELAKKILEKSNIYVDVASNGEQAIKLVKRNRKRYDLILMNLHMPIMDGFQTSKEIRKIEQNIPIIAISVTDSIENRQKVAKYKMNGLLTQPIDMTILYDTLIKNIRELNHSKIQYKNGKATIINEILNIEVLQKINLDEDQINKVLKNFLKQLECRFGNIIDNLVQKDTNAKFLVRSLKGISINIGANRLFEACLRIDKKFKQNFLIDYQDIKKLKVEINNVKDKLAYLNDLDLDICIREKSEIGYLEQDTLKETFIKAIKKLSQSDFFTTLEQEDLYKSILYLTKDEDIVYKFKESMEDFDYKKAENMLIGIKALL